MELNKNNEPKFKFYPKDSPNFTPGLEVELFSAVGQSFIEASDSLQPEFKKSPAEIELRLKLTDSSKAKPVKDLIKGLFAMFKMQKELFEDDEELQQLVNGLTIDFTNDDNYLYVYLHIVYKDLVWFLTEFLELDEIEDDSEWAEFYRIDSFNGKSYVKVAIEWVPVSFITTKLMDFINTCFSVSAQGFSENQLNLGCRFFKKMLESEGVESDDDIVCREMLVPLLQFTREYVNKAFEFEKTYLSSEVKRVIFEVNENFPEGEYSMQNELKKFQEEFVDETVKMFQEYSKGFFKPYFNILNCVDFNQFKLSICVNEKVALFSADVKTQGITEFLLDKFIK